MPASSHSAGSVPRPGAGRCASAANMPRISAVASTGGGRSGVAGRDVVSVVISSRGASGAASCTATSTPRTKKPRWRLASTSPCASSWS